MHSVDVNVNELLLNLGTSQWRRFLLNSGGRHGERGARAYNGGLGAEPPAGSRGRALGQGVRVAKPP